MLFHACGWDNPKIALNFRPFGLQRFAGSGGAQDGDLQGTGCECVAVAQVRHESRQIPPRQSWMMSNSLRLIARRQQVFQVPTPYCRVLALPMPLGPGKV